jgi:serum/glucocorticoid-regulated kinase 2
MRQRF